MPASQNTITKGMILNLSSNQDVYERGEKYYREGKLLSYNATEEPNSETSVRASVQGHYKNYEITLKFDTKEALATYTCSCESHSIWRGACKHVVAVLFAHMEGHARVFSAGKMKQHANALTTKLEGIIFDSINEAHKVPVATSTQVKLVPTLHSVSRGSMYLTFSVGKGRMYVIKNIAGFVNSFKTGEKIKYGEGLTLVHNTEMFDPKSQELLRFIMSEDDTISEVGKRLGRQFQLAPSSLTASRELHLTPRNVDSFFDLFWGETLESVSDFGAEIKLLDGIPPIAVSVRHLAAGLMVQGEVLEYRSFKGNFFHYILISGVLYRMQKADGRVLSTLLKALAETPSREILISGNDQQKFIAVILPVLKRMGVIASVEGESTIENIAPLIAKMYFDAEKNDVVGRVEFNYGDIKIDPFAKAPAETTRDVVLEYTIIRKLQSLGFYEDPKKGVYRLSGDDMIHGFLFEATGIESLRENAEVFVSDALQKKAVKASSPQIGLRLSGNLLQVSLEDAGYEIGELLNALEAYRLRKKFHRLKDGRFISLEDEAVISAVDFLEGLDVSQKSVKGKNLDLPAYKALYVDELIRTGNLENTHTLKRDKNLETLLSHFDSNTTFKVPKGLGTILREYQKVGYNWLKTLAHFGFGGILADDMGLGKTLQIISVLASDSSKKLPSLVVCPTSLLFNWQNEIARFAPKLKTQVVSGLPEKRHELLKQKGIDVFITTYDMLKRDVEQYHGREFQYIIADEAQNIKNPGTQAAKSIKEINGKVRFALTGTPIENTLTELWSIFDFIMPGYLHSAHKFSRLYETPIIKHGSSVAAKKLRSQIAPFVLRRVKQSVLTELPEKTETLLQAEMTLEQKKIYQANLMEALGVLDEMDNRMQIFAKLTRLRQACCHPSLFLENYDGGSGKLNLAIETVQLALESGRRVLLFSQFTSMLQIIKEEMDEAEIKYFYLDGSVKSKERMDMTERFNAGEGELFLISLKAGGVGLNLTGADVVIHYDPWWNPSVMDQASDRAHRYGQKKAVQVFNIVAKDSIEEKIMELQDRKRDLIDSVVTEGGSFINLLSEEEVRKLFKEA